jgi:hypothetical protein
MEFWMVSLAAFSANDRMTTFGAILTRKERENAEGNQDNLARAAGARATASSLLPGHGIHQIHNGFFTN